MAKRHAQYGDGANCHKRVCSICARTFYAAKPHASLCSERCKQQAVAARRRAVRKANGPRKCSLCGESFTARRGDALYCSNACRQAAHRQRPKAGKA